MRRSRPRILLVDDDDVARESTIRHLRRHGLENDIRTAADGLEALEILTDAAKPGMGRCPTITLLDLNMPRMDGFEFLRALRSDPVLGTAVVFVFTTSDAESDRLQAYRHNVAGYLVKSTIGPNFAKLADLLTCYGNAVTLP